MYQGNGTVSLTPTGLIASNRQMRAAMEAEAKQASYFMDKPSCYPIIGLFIQYRF